MKSKRTKVFVIVLHFGDSTTTNACLKSILKYQSNFERVLVIDNGLNFKTSIHNKRIEIIKPKSNLGYSAGMNIGIKYSLSQKADYVLLLNNDTKTEKDFISALLNLFKREKKLGIAGPAIKFRKSGKIVYDLGGKVNLLIGRTSHHEVKRITNTLPQNVDYVSGCCMLIKKEVLEKIGLLDEKFFLYYEDVDFCLRARKAGFIVSLLPEVSIYHDLSHSIGRNSSKAIYFQTVSGLFFGGKLGGLNKLYNFIYIFLQSVCFFLKNPTNGKYALLAFVNKNLFQY